MSFNAPGVFPNLVSPVVENVTAGEENIDAEEDMEEEVAKMVVADTIQSFLVVAHLQRRSAVSQRFLVA
jgi:hypothetical protein